MLYNVNWYIWNTRTELTHTYLTHIYRVKMQPSSYGWRYSQITAQIWALVRVQSHDIFWQVALIGPVSSPLSVQSFLHIPAITSIVTRKVHSASPLKWQSNGMKMVGTGRLCADYCHSQNYPSEMNCAKISSQTNENIWLAKDYISMHLSLAKMSDSL